MNEEKDLLQRVVQNRLKAALSRDENSEEAILAFKEGMEATDRLIELEKIENAKRIELEKINRTKAEQKRNDVVTVIKEVAVPVGIKALTIIGNVYFMYKISNFEKDYTWTTTAGRSTRDFFKWN